MKKKILFCVTSLTYGGTERVLLNYVKLLSLDKEINIQLCVLFKVTSIVTMEDEFKKYVDIIYLSTADEGNQFIKLLDKYTKSYRDKINYAIFRLKINKSFKKRFIKKYSKSCTDVLVQADTSMPSFIRDFKYVKKKIVFIHFAPDKLYNNFFRKYRIKNWKKSLEKFTGIVATSEEMLSELNYLKSTKREVVLIYNPHIEEQIKLKSNEYLELPQGFKENEFIVSIARLDENQKDFTTLIKSIYYLKHNLNFQSKLIIVGDGRDRQILQNLTNELSLSEDIAFVGMQKNTYSFTKQSNLFVLSSKFEGLPSVLVEALLLDKLIISSDCPTGPREILQRKELLSKPQNHIDLATKIYTLLNDENLQKRMHEHLILQKSKFSSETAYYKFIKLL